MTVDEFWTLVESTKKSDPDEHVERLTAKLAKQSPDKILAFGNHWYRFHSQAYTNALWGAAYIINGGCSDDGFHYFRGWLILKGRAVYESAMADADTLAKVRVEPDEAECECYIAQDAFQQATGLEHDAFYDQLEKAHGHAKDAEQPAGDEWDFDDDDAMKKRYPKLHKKFSDG